MWSFGGAPYKVLTGLYREPLAKPLVKLCIEPLAKPLIKSLTQFWRVLFYNNSSLKLDFIFNVPNY